DEGAQVEAGNFPVRWHRVHHVHLAPEAELIAYRHHYARGEPCGEGVPLPLHGLTSAALRSQSRGVVGFREGDGGRHAAEALVLLDRPPIAEVPPFGGVEDEVEAGLTQREYVFHGSSERLGEEPYAGIDVARGLDEEAPELGGHLVGRVAAESAKAEADRLAHEVRPVLPQRLSIRR